jgi:hypothetical protein
MLSLDVLLCVTPVSALMWLIKHLIIVLPSTLER